MALSPSGSSPVPSPISAMSGNGIPNLSGIRQIVKLKEMIQKWHSVTLGSKGNRQPCYVGHRDISRVIKQTSVEDAMCCDSDEEIACNPCPKPGPPPDVPKGYLAVYVGSDLQRFIIPTTYLTHSTFKALLDKAEDEFGFQHSGGLTIPCEIDAFKSLLRSMDNEQKKHPQYAY